MSSNLDNEPSLLQAIKQKIESDLRGNLWDNARFVLCDVPLDPAQAKRILPWGMGLQSPARATLFIVDYTKTSFTIPYKEAAALIHVRTPLGNGLHCPWMVVDDDTALIYGRELLGYPKKWADIKFEEKGASVSSSVTRRGVKVMSMELERGAPEPSPKPVFNYKTFNVGGMGQTFAIQPIWMFKPTEVIHESYTAKVTLKMEESESDPVARLVSGDPFNGRFVALDIPGTGGAPLLPVGIAGIRWFLRTYNMRYR